MVEIELKSDPKRPRWLVSKEVDQHNGHFHWKVSSRSHVWRPPTDVFVTDEDVVVRVEIPGMKEAEFAVTLDERHLVIRGARPDPMERRSFHQMEIHFGEFSTEVELHWAVEAKNIEAEYEDGFLTVILPKASPQQIEIGK